MKRINIVISGRSYPIKIESEDEAMMRRIEKDINLKINEYQLQYSTQDAQDRLAMALLTLALELEKVNADNTNEIALQKINQIDQLLSKVL